MKEHVLLWTRFLHWFICTNSDNGILVVIVELQNLIDRQCTVNLSLELLYSSK